MLSSGYWHTAQIAQAETELEKRLQTWAAPIREFGECWRRREILCTEVFRTPTYLPNEKFKSIRASNA